MKIDLQFFGGRGSSSGRSGSSTSSSHKSLLSYEKAYRRQATENALSDVIARKSNRDTRKRAGYWDPSKDLESGRIRNVKVEEHKPGKWYKISYQDRRSDYKDGHKNSVFVGEKAWEAAGGNEKTQYSGTYRAPEPSGLSKLRSSYMSKLDKGDSAGAVKANKAIENSEWMKIQRKVDAEISNRRNAWKK